MKPTHARAILKAWARGAAHALPAELATAIPEIPCTLTLSQRAQILTVLRGRRTAATPAPPLQPQWLSPP